MIIIELFSKILTSLIPNKNLRTKWRDEVKTFFYAFKVITRSSNIGKNFVCLDFSYCNKKTSIGNDVRFNGVKIDGVGQCSIGNFCQFGKDIHIITSNHDYDGDITIPYGDNNIEKGVVIKDFVWVGTGAIILPGTIVEEGAIIQAGCIVHGKIPRCAIVGGNPCKIIKYRNIGHFDKLKQEQKFLYTYKGVCE